MSAMRQYATIKALRMGEVVDLGGIRVKMDEGEIKPGDLYVAERNTGPHLLTAREVVRTEHGHIDYIHPTTLSYSFDGSECVKVCEA